MGRRKDERDRMVQSEFDFSKATASHDDLYAGKSRCTMWLLLFSIFLVVLSIVFMLVSLSMNKWIRVHADSSSDEISRNIGLFEQCSEIRSNGVLVSDTCSALDEPLRTTSLEVFGVVILSLCFQAMALLSALYLAVPCYRVCCDCIGSKTGIREWALAIGWLAVSVIVTVSAVGHYARETRAMMSRTRRSVANITADGAVVYSTAFELTCSSAALLALSLVILAIAGRRKWSGSGGSLHGKLMAACPCRSARVNVEEEGPVRSGPGRYNSAAAENIEIVEGDGLFEPRNSNSGSDSDSDSVSISITEAASAESKSAAKSAARSAATSAGTSALTSDSD